MENDVYYTLEKPGRFELKIKNSRFIGHAASANSKDVAEMIVESISKQYHDATHHCSAYRIGTGDRSIFRMNDANEPSGTAGRVILKAIDRRRLSDVVCVVTRYFGGTKLGTGGLSRAYGECAAGTLKNSEIVEKYMTERVRIVFDYEWTGKVMALIKKHDCKIERGNFQVQTEMDVLVRKSRTGFFKQDLMNVTSGKIIITDSGI